MLQNADFNGCGGGCKRRVEAEDVISKMKDDGDFDRLRLKIIRKLRENEELRSNIVSMVKQSGALNRHGAESMKPRQLADAIHHEIGEKVMSQISDGLWSIIRSPEGMKTEITDTVQSVYVSLSLNENDNRESSLGSSIFIQGEAVHSGVNEINGSLSDRMPGEVPHGVASTNLNHQGESNRFNQPNKVSMLPVETPANHDFGLSCTSKVSSAQKSGHIKDEDPDLPPGFS